MPTILWNRIGRSFVRTLIIAGFLTGCNSAKLRGTKSTEPTPQRQPAAADQATRAPSQPPADNTQSNDVPYEEPVRPEGREHVPTPTPTPEPTPTPTPEPSPTPTPSPTPDPTPTPTPTPDEQTDTGGSQGSLSFVVAAISNMEKGYQATNPGFRVIISQNEQVVAAGAMTIEAVINAERVNAQTSSGFPAVALQPRLQYVSNSLKPGDHSGTIRICMAQDPRAPMEQSACTRLQARFGAEREGASNGQLDRPFQWVEGKSINFTVGSNRDIKVTSYGGGFSLNGAIPNLSTHHPIYAAAVGEKTKYDARSPIVLDLNKNGQLDLVSAWDKSQMVLFDLEGNGSLEHTGWIAAGDALLALDLNQNSQIDSGLELFGQYSWSMRGREFPDGFAALAQYDDNADGQIDARDAVFEKLLVWRDTDCNGLTKEAELSSLKDVNIVSVVLRATPTAKQGVPEMIAGNQVRLRGEFAFQDGTRGKLADVWFQVRSGRSLSEYLASPIQLPAEGQ